MTDPRGLERPQGPDWWLASDGRWYPPETRPGASPSGSGAVAIAPAPTTTEAKPARRPSPLGLAAIAVLVIGLVLGIVGLVSGGPDETGREERREAIAAERTRFQATEARAEDAEADLDAVLAQAEAYRADGEAILATSADACSCGEETTDAFDAVLAGIDTLVADPSQANADAVDAVAENRLNPELDRLWALQDEIRAMMADRAPLPGG